MLLAEIVRNKLPIAPFRHWFFVDTLAILDATKDEVGPCLKLQCLVRHYTDSRDLRAPWAAGGEYTRAHMEPVEAWAPSIEYVFVFASSSALDDCIALRHVMGFLAARLDIGLVELHRQFEVVVTLKGNRQVFGGQITYFQQPKVKRVTTVFRHYVVLCTGDR